MLAPPPLMRDAALRGLAIQVLFLGLLALLIYAAAATGLANMRAHHIPVDFSFWNEPAGFDIDQHLVAYSAASTYGRAFLVGLLNTLLVAAIGIALASLLGFAVGAARLSRNFVIGGLSALYVEAMRNVPLLLQLLFWYNVVLEALPGPQKSLALAGAYLSERPRALPAGTFVCAGGDLGARRLLRRPYGRRRLLALGKAGWQQLAVACGSPHPALPACDLLRRGPADRARCAGAQRLQLFGRCQAAARVRGAAFGTRSLYSGLHCRNRPRRHRRRAQGAERGGRRARVRAKRRRANM